MKAEQLPTSEEQTLAEVEIPDGVVETQSNTIYLSGPIRKDDSDGRDWRNTLIEGYSNKFEFINPLDFYDPQTHEILNDPIQLSDDSDKKQILPSEYVMEDKLNILSSEYVFVGIPEVIARGTMMEAMFAYASDIPVFTWTNDGQEESGWLYHHSEFMSSDREAVMKAIENYE